MSAPQGAHGIWRAAATHNTRLGLALSHGIAEQYCRSILIWVMQHESQTAVSECAQKSCQSGDCPVCLIQEPTNKG